MRYTDIVRKNQLEEEVRKAIFLKKKMGSKGKEWWFQKYVTIL